MYAQVTIGNSSEHRVSGTYIFSRVSKNQKKVKNVAKKVKF